MKINIKFIALLAIICLLSISAVAADGDAQTDTGNLPATDDADNGEINNDDTGQATDEGDSPTTDDDGQATDEGDSPTTDDDGQATDDGESNKAKTLDDVYTADKPKIDASKGIVDGDIIILNKDYDLTKTIYIDSKITLDGQGFTLNGNEIVRIIQVRTNDVTLKNIVFKNGNNDTGAAILPMLNQDGLKEFFSVKIINCTFINNKANYGGAFYTEIGGNEIINCTFDSNTATKTGGAIQINGNNNLIENNIFKNNKATSTNGGAIAFLGGTNNNNKITNNTFNLNSASGDGGALYLEYGNNNQIIDNKFIKNTAGIGGAASFHYSGSFTLDNNTFTDNTASKMGGAIRANIEKAIKVTISNNDFKNNNAPSSGGAMHIDSKNNIKNIIEIAQNIFDNNNAKQGDGGSIKVSGDTVSISNNIFTNTIAKTNGGAITTKGTTLTIQSNNFTNAKAANGGAIHVESGTATIKSNNFTECSASNRGGAIKSDTKVIVTENTFKSNTATDKGSDILIYYSGSKISQIKNNDFVTYTANSIITFSVPVEIQDNKGFKEKLTIETLNKNYAVTTTAKYLTVVLKNSKGTGVSGKKLTISLNGKTYTGTTDANGKYKTKIAISAIKKYSCTVKFAGDETNLVATNTFYLYVNKAATKITSPAKTFKKSATKKVVVTLKSGKKVLAKKKVTIKINGKTYKGTTNAKGKATIKIKITKKGTFKGTLKYVGNKTYKACTGKVTIKIK